MRIALTLNIDLDLEQWRMRHDQTPEEALIDAPNAVAEEVLHQAREAASSELYAIDEQATLDMAPSADSGGRVIELLTTCKCEQTDHIRLVAAGVSITDILVGTQCPKCGVAGLRKAWHRK